MPGMLGYDVYSRSLRGNFMEADPYSYQLPKESVMELRLLLGRFGGKVEILWSTVFCGVVI